MSRRPTANPSQAPGSQLLQVLEEQLIPALRAEQDPEGEEQPLEVEHEPGEHPSLAAQLRGGWILNAHAEPIDDIHSLLRISVMCGYIISDTPSAAVLIGNMLEPTPFHIRTHSALGLVGEICVTCDLNVRADDADLVKRRIIELSHTMADLVNLLRLRIPHFLDWWQIHGLEMEWEDLPHDDLGKFLDHAMAAPRSERTPFTLLRVAYGLERWKDVLQLLRDHTKELSPKEHAPVKCMAHRELKQWLPAIRAAKAAGIKDGCYPNMRWASPSYVDCLIQSGDHIEALRILGKHRDDEPSYYDWLRGLAYHFVGDRKQAGAAFQRHFKRWPCDMLGIATLAMLEEE